MEAVRIPTCPKGIPFQSRLPPSPGVPLRASTINASLCDLSNCLVYRPLCKTEVGSAGRNSVQWKRYIPTVPEPDSVPVTGSPPSGFSLGTFTISASRTLHLADVVGKVVSFGFWRCFCSEFPSSCFHSTFVSLCCSFRTQLTSFSAFFTYSCDQDYVSARLDFGDTSRHLLLCLPECENHTQRKKSSCPPYGQASR